MSPSSRRLSLVVAGLGLAVTGYGLGLYDPVELAAAIRGTGSWGGIVYVAAFSFFLAVGVPGVVFLFAAALVWPGEIAFTLGLVGSVLGSWLGFALARTAARDWVAQRLKAGNDRFSRFDKRLADNAFLAVALLRLTFFLFPPVSWALGLSKMRTLPYLVGTLAGVLPGVWLCTVVGASLFDWLRAEPPWVWGAAAVVAAAGAVIVRALRPHPSNQGEVRPSPLEQRRGGG
ncbi:MAG TPA: VTT domain-containing protein [Myxococcota bacterium]|jgi:uncharacterized membrane protein YdjX (TVP38/TMEM64 family)